MAAADQTDKARLDEAFSQLYKAHLRDVYSYSYYRVGNHHDAEDLTEQTFLQAYRHFERAQRESNGRPLRPWLIRIAHNLAANYYRDRSRTPQTQLEDAAIISTPHPTEVLVESLLRSALVPIEPSGALTDRLEERLSELTSIAAEELADWELSSMRDPRNWARPVAAVVIGGAAAGALVVVRARQQHRKRESTGLRALEKSVRGVTADVQKRLSR